MPKTPAFAEILRLLEQSERALSPRSLKAFSDINRENLSALQHAWPKLPTQRKYYLLEALLERFDEEAGLSFDALAEWALNDSDSGVRYRAMGLLTESENTALIKRLIALGASDPDENVRVRAASLLGNFVLLGELEEISSSHSQQAEEALFTMRQEGTPAAQRAALEALGASSNLIVTDLISDALQKTDPQWLVSAMRAIGRSANQDWEEAVIECLDFPNNDIRHAAVQAAGSLGLKSARQPLLAMLEDPEDVDDETLAAAVWSLSEIGGEDVRETLVQLYDSAEESGNEDAAEFLEEALENLDFTEDADNFGLFDIQPEDD